MKHRSPGKILPAWVLVLLLGGPPVAATPGGDLDRTNQVLRVWLRLSEADRPYLLLDREAGELRLQHGRALLRRVPLRRDALGEEPRIEEVLRARLRRYRRRDPWSAPQVGAFDWEQRLIEAATPECALYFSGGTLIYASTAWGRPRAPCARVGAEDVMALYNTLERGVPLVVLPRGWNEEKSDGAD